MPDHTTLVIGPYDGGTVSYREYDSRAADVARQVAAMVTSQWPNARIEHIGSTAVPRAGGRGIVDLLAITASDGEFERMLEQLGLQRATAEDEFFGPFPLFVGAAQFEGQPFHLHLHMIPAEAEQIDSIKFFRTCLRADSELLRAYLAAKRAALANGAADPANYQRQKAEFFKQVLG